MRLGARLLASLLIITLYLPVGVVQADGGPETFAVSLASTLTAGVPSATLEVDALDNGDPDPTYTGTVTFTSSDSGADVALPSDYTFTGTDSGSKTFTVTLVTAGSQTVTATDTGDSAITGTGSTDVAAGAPATVVLSGMTVDLASGVTRDVNAIVTDAFSNPVPNQQVIFNESSGTGTVDNLSSPTTDGTGAATDTVTGDQTGSIVITGTAGTAFDTLGLQRCLRGARSRHPLAQHRVDQPGRLAGLHDDGLRPQRQPQGCLAINHARDQPERQLLGGQLLRLDQRRAHGHLDVRRQVGHRDPDRGQQPAGRGR